MQILSLAVRNRVPRLKSHSFSGRSSSGAVEPNHRHIAALEAFNMLSTFDIFSGTFRQVSVNWIAAVEGFEQAYQRMVMLADDKPGPYFIFNSKNRTCAASIDDTVCPYSSAPQN